jgi:hypothetical protein
MLPPASVLGLHVADRLIQVRYDVRQGEVPRVRVGLWQRAWNIWDDPRIIAAGYESFIAVSGPTALGNIVGTLQSTRTSGGFQTFLRSDAGAAVLSRRLYSAQSVRDDAVGRANRQ